MAKTKATNKRTAKETEDAGDKEVTICRRRSDRRSSNNAADPGEELADLASEELGEGEELADVDVEDTADSQMPPGRPKVQRRRQIDPTTCERDYTDDEIEFMHALDAYKRSSGRMFPTCSEILEVVRSIGYEKIEIIEAAIAAGNVTDIDEEANLEEAERDSIALQPVASSE